MLPFDFEFTLRGKKHFETGHCEFCCKEKDWMSGVLPDCWTYKNIFKIVGICKYRILDYHDWYLK